MTSTYSDALVAELARIHAIAWECHDVSPTASIEPDVDDHDRAAMCAVLDHLMELGWRHLPSLRFQGSSATIDMRHLESYVGRRFRVGARPFRRDEYGRKRSDTQLTPGELVTLRRDDQYGEFIDLQGDVRVERVAESDGALWCISPECLVGPVEEADGGPVTLRREMTYGGEQV